ncbi:helix-turn-helix domain-containing protein [Roseibium sediminicola]|uniref:Helix-turn-helix domain-containing protein n=1 Tax=Roseibium sediminicola TaxID=2933272 RepID=A0ABT0H1L9_9HYPH|nr:helix-turn-helix transcriptional regulator [Roseibium sp. CAU 1639]MCK7615207.1 helix-turn-helix domain-containing protein [Roseibium sp. CAU 1639]
MMRLDREALGAALLEARMTQDISLRGIEAVTGISRTTISRAERAHPDIFASAETVVVLCHFYQIDPRDYVEPVSRESTHETSEAGAG